MPEFDTLYNEKVKLPELGTPAYIWTLKDELQYGNGGLNVLRFSNNKAIRNNSSVEAQGAFQAAVDEAISTGINKVFIPPTSEWYSLDDGPVSLNGVDSSVGLVIEGEGDGSYIRSNHEGYVFNRDTDASAGQAPVFFDKMRISDDYTGGGENNGAIRLDKVIKSRVSNSLLRSRTGKGLAATSSSFSLTIDNVSLKAQNEAGSVGLLLSNHATVIGCNWLSLEKALDIVPGTGLQITVIGGRCEVCILGFDLIMQGGAVLGTYFEACDTAILARSFIASKISGARIYGTSNAPSGQSKYGIRAASLRYSEIDGIEFGGSHDTAGVELGDIDLGSETINANFNRSKVSRVRSNAITGDDWIVSDEALAQTVFENTNFPSLTVADLPPAADVDLGRRLIVTDASATTFGSTVAGSGANTVPVWSDGTNWKIG